MIFVFFLEWTEWHVPKYYYLSSTHCFLVRSFSLLHDCPAFFSYNLSFILFIQLFHGLISHLAFDRLFIFRKSCFCWWSQLTPLRYGIVSRSLASKTSHLILSYHTFELNFIGWWNRFGLTLNPTNPQAAMSCRGRKEATIPCHHSV